MNTKSERKTQYKQREVFNLPYNSSGKMAYFCVRIESGGRIPWRTTKTLKARAG